MSDTSSPNKLNTKPLQTFEKQLNGLHWALHKSQLEIPSSPFPKTAEDGQAPATFNAVDALRQALVARDAVERLLAKDSDGLYLSYVTDMDDQLFKLGSATVNRHWVNMAAWREHRNNAQGVLTNENVAIGDETEGLGIVRTDGTMRRLGWWWYLDTGEYPSFRVEPFRRWLWRIAVTLVVVGGIILLGIFSILSTLPSLASFFNTGFTNLGIAGLNEDTIAIATLLSALVLVIWRAATNYAVNTAKFVNDRLRRVQGKIRPFIMSILPISPLVTGAGLSVLLFVVINFLLVNMVLLPFNKRLETKECLSDTDLNFAPNMLASDQSLTALARTGRCLERIGNTDGAQEIYLQVLETDPTCTLAQYYLAEIYLQKGSPEQALPVLDYGLRQLNASEPDTASTTAEDAELCQLVSDKETIEAFIYLFAVSRGHALLDAGFPVAANSALKAALIRIRDYDDLQPALFYLPLTEVISPTDTIVELNQTLLDEAPDEAGEEIGSLNPLEGFYYYARTYDAWAREAPRERREIIGRQALKYWRVVEKLSQGLDDSEARRWRSEAELRLTP